MTAAFGREEVGLWAKEGLTIGSQTIRSWESAIEYYRVSPPSGPVPVVPVFHAVGPLRGPYLSQDSPHAGGGVFQIERFHRPKPAAPVHSRWAGLGRSLYKGTWKSSTLAAKFFEVSPDLVRSLPLLGRRGLRFSGGSAFLQVLRRRQRMPRAGPGRSARYGTGTGTLPGDDPRPDRFELAGGQDLPRGGAQGVAAGG